MRVVISPRQHIQHKSKKSHNFSICTHSSKTHKSNDTRKNLKSSDSIVSSCRNEYKLQNMKTDRSSSDIVHLGKRSGTQSSKRLLIIIHTHRSRISRQLLSEYHIFSSSHTEKRMSDPLSVLSYKLSRMCQTSGKTWDSLDSIYHFSNKT